MDDIRVERASDEVKAFIEKLAPFARDVARGLSRGTSRFSDSAIAQQALLDAFDCPEYVLYGSPEEQEAWIRMVVIRTAINMHRDQRRSKRDRSRECSLGVDSTMHLVDRQPSPAEQAARAERAACVMAAIQQLTWLQHMAIRLHYFEELTHEQIAGLLDTERASVTALLMRSKAKLRELLKPVA